MRGHSERDALHVTHADLRQIEAFLRTLSGRVMARDVRTLSAQFRHDAATTRRAAAVKVRCTKRLTHMRLATHLARRIFHVCA